MSEQSMTSVGNIMYFVRRKGLQIIPNNLK